MSFDPSIPFKTRSGLNVNRLNVRECGGFIGMVNDHYETWNSEGIWAPWATDQQSRNMDLININVGICSLDDAIENLINIEKENIASQKVIDAIAVLELMYKKKNI